MTHSLEERIFLVMEFLLLDESVTATRINFQCILSVANGPQPNAIKAIYEKFNRTGSVANDEVKTVERYRSPIAEENVQVVEETTYQRVSRKNYSRMSIQNEDSNNDV